MRKKQKEQLRKEQQLKEIVPIADKIMSSYTNTLETDIKYSLSVDPENKFNMSQTQKEFIKNYCQFKSIPLAAEVTGISDEEAKAYFISYSSQEEIKRINRAMYHQQFKTKMLTMDEIAGYLSSLITDENVPLADRLKTTDKLRVIDTLIKLNEMKAQAIYDPSTIVQKDVETEIKELSVDTIRALLSTSDDNSKKDETIAKLNEDKHLTDEEVAYMKTLPLKDLLELLKDTTSK